MLRTGALAYVARQGLSAAVLLLAVVAATFVAMRWLPGDAAHLTAGMEAAPGADQRLREALGLDQPLGSQLVAYLRGLVRGDLGYSLRQNRPVREILVERLPVTVRLAALGFGLALGLGLGLGLAAGLRPGSAADRAVQAYTALGLAFPEFWVGLMLVLTLAVGLRWFPVLGFPDHGSPAMQLWHLALPATALALPRSAQIARLVRAQMMEQWEAEYVRTALSKGLSPGRVAWHMAANALPATLPLVFLELGGLVTGSVIVEQVFALPGLGQALVGAIYARDYALVNGITVVAVAVFAAVNWMADAAQALVDPRVRYG